MRAHANEVRKIESKRFRSGSHLANLSPSIGLLPHRGSATCPPPQAVEEFFIKSGFPHCASPESLALLSSLTSELG
jgi:hypothetical protein